MMKKISQEHRGPRCAALGHSHAQRGRLVSLQGGQQPPAPGGTRHGESLCLLSITIKRNRCWQGVQSTCVSLLVSKNAMGEVRRKMCSFLACSPFPCDVSGARDREDGVAPARHPAPRGTLCSASAGVPGCGAPRPLDIWAWD